MEQYAAEILYDRIHDFMDAVDPAWRADIWRGDFEHERATLAETLGTAHGTRVLDVSCGEGPQAIALALAGFDVLAMDASSEVLELAQAHAREVGARLAFRAGDARADHGLAGANFDWVISCKALDHLEREEDLRQAVRRMYEALRPGGRCYLQLRDLDLVLETKPRYDVREERQVPEGVILRLDDWEYPPGAPLVHHAVFLHRNDRATGYKWTTRVFSSTRLPLRKSDVAALLRETGFRDPTFLAQASPWHPYRLVATK